MEEWFRVSVRVRARAREYSSSFCSVRLFFVFLLFFFAVGKLFFCCCDKSFDVTLSVFERDVECF